MKKTIEEFAEWLGLKVGDKIEVEDDNRIYIITKNYILNHLEGLAGKYTKASILTLVNKEIKILSKQKRVGDLKCDGDDVNCIICCLKAICSGAIKDNERLFEVLQRWKQRHNFDQEIYDILKARLDKEVNNNE